MHVYLSIEPNQTDSSIFAYTTQTDSSSFADTTQSITPGMSSGRYHMWYKQHLHLYDATLCHEPITLISCGLGSTTTSEIRVIQHGILPSRSETSHSTLRIDSHNIVQCITHLKGTLIVWALAVEYDIKPFKDGITRSNVILFIPEDSAASHVALSTGPLKTRTNYDQTTQIDPSYLEPTRYCNKLENA